MSGPSFDRDAETGNGGSSAQIDLLCEQFSGQWEQDQRPDLSSFLEQVSGEAKETLLRNLLQYELHRRQCQGERPAVEEYLEQLPQFADLVRSVFHESQRTLTLHHEVDSPPAPRLIHPPASRLGEYRLVRELGSGAMGMVYEAVHRRGNRVALKTLPSVDADRLHQFKREFRSNSDINHPNLVALHELESDGSQWFLTMDLVEGQDFLSYVRPEGRLDAGRLQAAFAQLIEGVRALHSRHIVHRDLKPSNVMVTGEGRVVLMDFGLVAELEQSGRGRDQVVGTPAYMAPEQAAGQPVTVACDWYSAGVMLYESLTARPPFAGSARRVMRDKRRRNAPPVDQFGEIPDGLQDLAQLCMRLLDRDPQVRDRSLQAFAGRVAGVAAAAAGPSTRAGALVGREPQLAALQDALDEMQSRQQPITVFVSGQSGGGKTSLVESFLNSIPAHEATILTGRCYDREKVPFKALDSLIDAVTDFLDDLPRDQRPLLPDDIGMLARLFPELQRVEIVAQAAQQTPAELDERQTRQRAFGALRRLLKRIGRGRPLILFIDDLQWGDADSAEVLFQVMRPPGSPRLLLLGAFRQEESAGGFSWPKERDSDRENSFLQRWRQLQQQHDVALPHRVVPLGPLSDEQCVELATRLMGTDSRRELVRQQALEFAREAGGNPFLLIELIGSHEEGESIEPLPMRDVLARKLARLPDDAERLLQVVAVSGRALALREASQAAGHDVPAFSTVTRMCSERLLRLLGSGGNPDVDTYHDRIRETVLAGLGTQPRQALHRQVGEAIEALAGCDAGQLLEWIKSGRPHADAPAAERVYDLAYHFDASGDPGKAWLYGLLAAEQARKQFSPEVAAEQYALAKRNAAVCGVSRAAQFQIAVGLGQSLMLLGRYADAAQQLSVASELTDQGLEKARVQLLQAETAFKQSAITRSIGLYEQALRRLGRWAPRTKIGVGAGLLWDSIVQVAHTLLPSSCYQRRRSLGPEHDLAVELLNRLSMAYYFRNSLHMLWAHLAGMNLAERTPPTREQAFTYGLHAGIAAVIGLVSRGVRYSDRALQMARQQNDLLVQGHTYAIRCMALLGAGRYEDGVADGEQAVKLLRKTGDLWLLNHADLNVAFNHFGLGNLSTAIGRARTAYQRAMRIGDHTFAAGCVELLVVASGGRLPFDQLAGGVELSPDDILGTSALLQAEGSWHRYQGRLETAVEVLTEAWELPRRHHVINAYTVSAVVKLAAALRTCAEAAGGSAKRPLARRALQVTRQAGRLARFYPFAKPESLRELSLLRQAQGRFKQALRLATRSCDAARRQKARHEHAQSLLVRGRLALRLGLPEGGAQIEAAEATLAESRRMIDEAAGESE